MLPFLHRLQLSAAQRFLVITFGLSLLATLPFFPGLAGGFLFDDKPNIVQNFGIHIAGIDHLSLWWAANSFPGAPGFRPLAMISFALDFWLFGLNPLAFKLTNLIIHALTTCALAAFFRQLLLLLGQEERRAAYLALVLSLLWAVHPLQVSSVLYVVQRMQTLATLFLVLALWAYLLARQAQMQGETGKKYWKRLIICWLLAFASKEDAILLPAYTLALELTVLRFSAQRPALPLKLRRAYLLLTTVGAALFVFWALPQFWSSAAYPGRDFNSYERLLTQGRVLAMYLEQILLPTPSHLPFYYDDLIISRSWLKPASTLYAWLLVAGLLVGAFALRARRPLLALGTLLFFAGHFITSNIIGLELAFEHRNHFPLIGAVLVIGDLLMPVSHGKARWGIGVVLAVLLLAGYSVNTYARAKTWSNPLTLAETSVKLAQSSPRAWLALCRAHYDLSKSLPDNPHFPKAIAACMQGSKLPGSAMSLANVVILKSIRGDITQSDWDALLDRMHHVVMNVENAGIPLNMISNANRGIPIDLNKIITLLDVAQSRHEYGFYDYVDIARFMLHTAKRPDIAYNYLSIAVSRSPLNDPKVKDLIKSLEKDGYHEWAQNLKQMDAARGHRSLQRV